MTPDQIKQLRLEMKLTQKQFAEIFFVHTHTVSKWERGIKMPGKLIIKTMKAMQT